MKVLLSSSRTFHSPCSLQLPLPSSYRLASSLRVATRRPAVGKSGPLIDLSNSLSALARRTRPMSACVPSSFSRRSSAGGMWSIITTAARMTSPRLCGGTLVAMPTAMPVLPLTSSCGNRAGMTIGSSPVPS